MGRPLQWPFPFPVPGAKCEQRDEARDRDRPTRVSPSYRAGLCWNANRACPWRDLTLIAQLSRHARADCYGRLASLVGDHDHCSNFAHRSPHCRIHRADACSRWRMPQEFAAWPVLPHGQQSRACSLSLRQRDTEPDALAYELQDLPLRACSKIVYRSNAYCSAGVEF